MGAALPTKNFIELLEEKGSEEERNKKGEQDTRYFPGVPLCLSLTPHSKVSH